VSALSGSPFDVGLRRRPAATPSQEPSAQGAVRASGLVPQPESGGVEQDGGGVVEAVRA
jgi:hypothetical protein